MAGQIPVEDTARAVEVEAEGAHWVAPTLGYQRLALVNVVYWGEAGGAGWVLIDAGVMGSARAILSTAEARFGSGVPPEAIILTHGHFDHVGALRDLAEVWNVPVYAHERERPFLDGTSPYPPPDPTVGGGLMAASARFYPRGPIDVSEWLRALPRDGHVPGMPEWRWIATPGHTRGHISLWHEGKRTLIAGDAFITTAQESAYAVATQRPELHGPPMYFTPDWSSAEVSVQRLAALEPELVITGHGRALQGPEMRRALHALAREFRQVAVPKRS